MNKYEYLTGEERLTSNWSQIIEHPKFTYSPLGEALIKQREIQIDVSKSLNLSNKIDKSNWGLFPKNLLNDLIIYKLQNIIKLLECY